MAPCWQPRASLPPAHFQAGPPQFLTLGALLLLLAGGFAVLLRHSRSAGG